MKTKFIRSFLSTITLALVATASFAARAGETDTVPPQAISDNDVKTLPTAPSGPSDYTGGGGGWTAPIVTLPSTQSPSTGQMDYVPPPAIDSDTTVKAYPAY